MKLWPGRRDVDLVPLIDVHERPCVLPGPVRVAKVRPPQDLRKAYGRASATIHALRGEAALLRERIAELDDTLGDEQRLVVELQQALDERRPAPDPEWLSAQLTKVWYGLRVTGRPLEERWTAVAETAIDAVRGLWPLGADDVAALDDHPTDVAGGSEAVQGSAAPWAGESPAPGDTIRAHDGRWWRCPTIDIGHRPGTAGERTPCINCRPAHDLNRAPATADEHREQLAERAEAVLDRLARALAEHDEKRTGLAWTRMRPGLHEAYRGLADAVVLAGWRPPLDKPDSVDTHDRRRLA